MSSLTLIFVAACLFAIAYRFYGLFLATKVMNLRDERETPAVTRITVTSVSMNMPST